MKSPLMKIAPIIVFVIASLPSVLFAFAEVESDDGYFNARGAVDVYTGYSRYPGSESLYSKSAEAMASTGLRFILEGMAGEHVRFDFNAYQRLQSISEIQLFANGKSGFYRTDFLDYDWGDEENISALMAVDQLSMKLYLGPVDMTIGRQPVGLGTNYIFSPNDIFYPFSAETLDTSFRPGVDAFRMNARVGQLSQISVIGAMGYNKDDIPDWQESSTLVRASINGAGFDWSILGGKTAQRYLVGWGITGEVGVIGLRTEGNVSFKQDDESNPYVQASVGMDHRWENSLHLMLEYYYHGNGSLDKEEYVEVMLGNPDPFDMYMGEHYAGFMLSGEALPILTVQALIIANLTEPSAYISPAFVFNASDEIELIASATIPIGYRPKTKAVEISKGFKVDLPSIESEFGTYPYSLSVLSRFYF